MLDVLEFIENVKFTKFWVIKQVKARLNVFNICFSIRSLHSITTWSKISVDEFNIFINIQQR